MWHLCFHWCVAAVCDRAGRVPQDRSPVPATKIIGSLSDTVLLCRRVTFNVCRGQRRRYLTRTAPLKNVEILRCRCLGGNQSLESFAASERVRQGRTLDSPELAIDPLDLASVDACLFEILSFLGVQKPMRNSERLCYRAYGDAKDA